MTPTTECHNCGSIWGIGSEEYDWQQCDACGWRPGQPIDNEDDDEILIDDEDFNNDNP